ncbi:Sec-independent protein translocase protein TatB [Sphingomonas yunnanensis]|uniref:Sec-independent protein translocase protein TatB n=1 Tax=Sphingomonas yunnanensis TaxID=310400 RepID=UPI001CA7348D|nr:Sec-independent protein translocase protein TatB [Sphingomonas yunnanensis]MBY9062607.1 Sec-independent protein translocase protein TatB [Sphingomonas yunnanensis]
MFNIDSSEFLLVALVALVVIGPKDLPKAMRVVGYWVGRARAVGRQFRAGFDEMVREAELEEMEKKWKAENERIMREHPMIPPPPPEPASAEQAPAQIAHTPAEPSSAPSRDHPHEDHPPVMVEQPRVVPGAPHETPAADTKAPS